MPKHDPLQSVGQTFTYPEARAAGLSKRKLYRLRDEGRVEVLARGVFRQRDAELADEGLLVVAARSPLATLCLTSALVHHGLSDEIPAETDLALPRGSYRPRTSSPVRWHSFEAATFRLGRERLALDSERSIGVFSAERCIVDAFRLRNSEGEDVGREALRRWLRRRGAQPARLLALARHFRRVEQPLRRLLAVLL